MLAGYIRRAFWRDSGRFFVTAGVDSMTDKTGDSGRQKRVSSVFDDIPTLSILSERIIQTLFACLGIYLFVLIIGNPL